MVFIALLALFLSAFTHTQEITVQETQLACINTAWKDTAHFVNNMKNLYATERLSLETTLRLSSEKPIQRKALTELKKWLLSEEGVRYLKADSPTEGAAVKIIRSFGNLTRKKIVPEDFFKGSTSVKEQLWYLENSLKTNTPLLVPFSEICTCINKAETIQEGSKGTEALKVKGLKKFALTVRRDKNIQKKVGALALHYALLNDQNTVAVEIVKDSPHTLATMLDLYDEKYVATFAKQLYEVCFKDNLYPISTGCLQWMLAKERRNTLSLKEKNKIANVVRETIQEMGRRQTEITAPEKALLKTTETDLLEDCTPLTNAYFFNTMGMVEGNKNYFEKTRALVKKNNNPTVQEQVALGAAECYLCPSDNLRNKIQTLFNQMGKTLSATQIDHCVRATCLIDLFVATPEILEKILKSPKKSNVDPIIPTQEYKKSLELYRAYYTTLYNKSKHSNERKEIILKNEALQEIIDCDKKMLTLTQATEINHYLLLAEMANLYTENSMVTQATEQLFVLEKKVDILERVATRSSALAATHMNAKNILDITRRKITAMKNKAEQSK